MSTTFDPTADAPGGLFCLEPGEAATLVVLYRKPGDFAPVYRAVMGSQPLPSAALKTKRRLSRKYGEDGEGVPLDFLKRNGEVVEPEEVPQ